MSLFDKSIHVRVAAYYGIDYKAYSMPLHSHKRCEIMYVAQGQCRIETADSSEIYQENDFIFLDEQVLHSLHVSNGRCKIFNLEFECSHSPAGLSIANLSQADETFHQFIAKPRAYFSGTDSSCLGSAMRDCVAELTQHGDSTYLFALLFQRVLLELARSVQHNMPPKSIGYINRAEAFIQARFQENLRAEEVAGAVGVHPSYLQVLFHRHFGCGIMAHVSRLRLATARLLLQNTDRSVQDIAAEVGYNSRQHFGSAFKSAFGLSPQEYRKLYGLRLWTDTLPEIDCPQVKEPQ